MRICWPWGKCTKITSKTVVVELLHSGHKKAAFSCEHESLSRYLHQQARQDVARNVAQCFVLAADENRVAGYYTLSMASIPAHDLPDEQRKKLPNYPAYPVVLSASRKGKAYQLSGEHNLKSCVGGGVYSYTGSLQADQFSANYHSKYDTGTFLLTPVPSP